MNDPTLNEFIKANPLGVLSTNGEDGASGAVVYYMVDIDGAIYFNCRRDSKKFKDMLKNPLVAFTIFQLDPAMTLQAKGKAEVIEDVSNIEKTYTALLHRTFENRHVPPILQIGMGHVELMKITPTWMRLGSFSHEQGSREIFTMIVGENKPQ